MHVHLFACMQDTSMAAEEGLRFEREPYLLAFDTPSLARVFFSIIRISLCFFKICLFVFVYLLHMRMKVLLRRRRRRGHLRQ
jgi:hypothetical protein